MSVLKKSLSVFLCATWSCSAAAEAATADSARDAWATLVGDRAATRPEYVFVEEDPELPNVLIYGDSISIGYTQRVRAQLSGRADVFRLHCNGGPSGSFIENMSRMEEVMRDTALTDGWDFDWDIIHFNVGLHDLKYLANRKLNKEQGTQVASIEVYQANLRAIVAYLKQVAPKSQLVFATTTPVPEGSAGRFAGDAARYNTAAFEVLLEHPEIIINDLFVLTQSNHAQWAVTPGNVHFNNEGKNAQADAVTAVINELLVNQAPLRILPAGDSITAGNHAGETANYRFYLEKRLRDHGVKAQFYGIDGRQRGEHALQDRDNAGFPGRDIGQLNRVLRRQRTSGAGTAQFTSTTFDPATEKDVIDITGGVDIALVLVGTNEFDTVVPTGQTGQAFFESKYRSLFTFFEEEGVFAIVGTVTPFALGTSTAADTPEKVVHANQQRFPLLNAIVTEMANEFDGVTVVDHFTDFQNAAADAALIHTDGVHLTGAGQRLIARNFYEAILRMRKTPEPASQNEW